MDYVLTSVAVCLKYTLALSAGKDDIHSHGTTR